MLPAPSEMMIFRRLLGLVSLLLALSCPMLASAASYGYAPTTYSWVDNAAHTDVAWAGSAGCSGGWNSSPVDDDITAAIALPFPFTFGATAYNYVQVMSNGRLQFVAAAASKSYCGYGTQSAGPPPTYPYAYPYAGTNLDNTIRIYGADFCPAGGGGGCSGRVTYKTLGVTPYRTFVVTWSQMKEWNSGASLFNVQIILHENGDFVYQYKDIANLSQGAGQVGWQLTTADYDLVDLTSINSLAYTALRFYKPTAPIAEYRFDQCGGAGGAVTGAVPDSSATAPSLPGTVNLGGIVANNSNGKICTGFKFDGASTTFISVPHNAKLNQPKVSVAAWVRHSAAALKNWEAILAKGDTTYRLHLNGGCSINGITTAKAFTFGFNGGCGNADLNSGVVPVAGQWYHVVGTYDGATIKIFVNGVLQNSQALVTTIGNNAFPLYLGENSQATGRNWNGDIDEIKIFDRELPDTEVLSMYNNESVGLERGGTLRACSICGATLGAYNAFESSLPAGSITGPIKTKIAGATFASSTGDIRIVALNAARTAVDTTVNRNNIRVDVLDASNESGAPDANGCYTGATVITTLGPGNQSVSSGVGVISPSPNIANAYKRARLKIYSPPGSPTSIGCSSDVFAIRPAYIDAAGASVTDQTWLTAGAVRALVSANNSATANANLSANTDVVHAAGAPFTVAGLSARNAVAATTTNYDGQPTLVPGNLILPDPTVCITCLLGTFSVPSWTVVGGVLSTAVASYSEAGSFSWEVEDRSFAAVDAMDSTKLQRYFRSNALKFIGRFVPASYQLILNTPTLQTFGAADATCSAAAAAPKRSFTYLGQPFGYVTAPSVGVVAKNSAGATTVNYQGTPGSGGLWRLTTPLANVAASMACTAPTQTCASTRQDAATPKTRLLSTFALGDVTPGWDGTAATVSNVTLSSNNNGTGAMSFGADKLALYRTPTTPQAAYSAAVTLALQLDDLTEVGVPAIAGNPAAISGNLAATAIAFDTSAVGVPTGEFRYGILRMQSAFGSELLDLPIPIQTHYWNGTAFVQNSADHCTPLAASNVALASYQGGLNAGNMGAAHVTVTSITSGAGVINLLKPTGAARGSVDFVLNLGSSGVPANCAVPVLSTAGSTSAAMRFLSGNWCGANYDRDPTARATFGTSRTPLIYRRENY